jgi:hypothetical protein
MKTADPTLQSAADAAAAWAVPLQEDLEGFRLSEYLADFELEQLLAVVRAAFAAPVLALHVRWTVGTASGKGWCKACGEKYPCATVRALGVTE